MEIKTIKEASQDELDQARTFSSFPSIERLAAQVKSKTEFTNTFLADKVIGSNMSFPKIISLMGQSEGENGEWDRINNVNRKNLIIVKNDYILDYCYASLPESQRKESKVGFFSYWLGSYSDQILKSKRVLVKFVDEGFGGVIGRFSNELKDLIGMDEKYVNDHLYFHNLLDKLDSLEKPVLVTPIDKNKLELLLVPISLYLKIGNKELFRKILVTGGTGISYIIPPPMLNRPGLEKKMPFENFIRDLTEYNYENLITDYFPQKPLLSFKVGPSHKRSVLLFFRKSQFDLAMDIASKVEMPKPPKREIHPFHPSAADNWKSYIEMEKKMKNKKQ